MLYSRQRFTCTAGAAPLRNENKGRGSTTRRARLHGKEKGTTETGERCSIHHCGERGSKLDYGKRGSVCNPRNWRARLQLQMRRARHHSQPRERSTWRARLHTHTRRKVPRGGPTLLRREFNLTEEFRDLARLRPTLRARFGVVPSSRGTPFSAGEC